MPHSSRGGWVGTAIANDSTLSSFAKAGFRPLRQFDDPEYGRFWLLRHTAGSTGAFEAEAVGSPAALA